MKPLYAYDEVRGLLPQAYPFVFIDVIEALEPGNKIVCRKNVTGNEWMFPGHFPKQAIFPGVLLVEAMAQSAILLGKLSPSLPLDTASSFLLTAIKSRFLKPVVPGDQLTIETVSVKWLRTQGMVESAVIVDGETAAKAELTFAMIESSGQKVK